jgi:hypothetical protein
MGNNTYDLFDDEGLFETVDAQSADEALDQVKPTRAAGDYEDDVTEITIIAQNVDDRGDRATRTFPLEAP